MLTIDWVALADIMLACTYLLSRAPAPAMLYEGQSTGGLCSASQRFKLLGNPSLSDTTHNSQSTYIQPLTHADGSTTLLYMSDRSAPKSGQLYLRR